MNGNQQDNFIKRFRSIKYVIKIGSRVATAQGKKGIWKCIFQDGEKTGNSPKILKYVLHREFNSNTGKIWR